MNRILLAYDGSEPAIRALDATVELATRFGAFVGVISVVPIRAMNMGIDPWDDREVHADMLRDAQHRLREKGIEPLRQVLMIDRHPSQPNERTHDLDVDAHGALASQD